MPFPGAGVCKLLCFCFSIESNVFQWCEILLRSMGVYKPVTTISDPLRIAAVGFHGLRDLLAELAPSYGGEARVRILDKAYADAVDAIAELHRREGVDVVVSAGSNGSYLRQHLGLPVVLVQPDGLDIMQALAQASQADSP